MTKQGRAARQVVGALSQGHDIAGVAAVADHGLETARAHSSTNIDKSSAKLPVGALHEAQDDVFAAFPDEPPLVGEASRQEYLPSRGYVPVRQVLVQHRQGAPQRPAMLGKMVGAREFRPLVLYLLLLAADLLLAHNRRLPLRTLANMMSTPEHPCSVRQVRQAVAALKRRNLVHADYRGLSVELRPLREDGSGEPWTAPTGDDENPDLKPYMVVPHALFSDDVLDRLQLPGLATVLVALKETSETAVFSVSVERFAEWYGFSERTAERGYAALVAAGLMRVHRQLVRDSRIPGGQKAKYHRTLLGGFDLQTRRDARRRACQSARRTTTKKAKSP